MANLMNVKENSYPRNLFSEWDSNPLVSRGGSSLYD